MDAIAAAADYTRRTLYSYFRSRDEILLQVLCEDLTTRWRRQRKAMADAGTGLEKIAIWARVLFEFSVHHPETIRLQAYWDYRGIHRSRIDGATLARFEEINDELADGLRKVFRLGVDDGSLRQDLEIDLTISHFLYSVRIIIHRGLSPGYSFASFEPKPYFDHYLDLFCRGIRRRSD